MIFKSNLSYWARTFGVETVNGSLSGTQSVSGDSQVLHDPVGHDAQRGSWIHLNAAHFRRSNISCEVQGPIIFPLTCMSSGVKVMQGHVERRGGSLLYLPSRVQPKFGP